MKKLVVNPLENLCHYYFKLFLLVHVLNDKVITAPAILLITIGFITSLYHHHYCCEQKSFFAEEQHFIILFTDWRALLRSIVVMLK
jgi:hypothetical protein